MRHTTSSLALFVFTLMLVSAGFSQQASVTTVPNLVRYGGTLRDAQGAPFSSATVGITFAIYNQQDGGAPVWMETQNVSTDAAGSYSVLLGSTGATGLPTDLFSQQEQRWLGVQVQGQAEEPRVLLVSVPYAFKAHEAETLAGKSISDFVLANGTNSSARGNANPASSSPANNSPATTPGISKGAASAGPTNFSGSTADQIVGVTQSGSGAGVNASAPSKGVVGTATATSGTVIGVEGGSAGSGGYGVYGNVSSPTGATVGVKGNSTSTAGTGVRGTNTATSGATAGVSGYVASAAGIAGSFNNAAGGKILSGQNNGVENFSVDGSGNVNSTSGTYQIGGSSILSIGSPADENLFLGVGAGSHNTAGTGTLNTFSGFEAGAINGSGSLNTFYGNQAGRNGTSASYNTFSGVAAGYANNGSYNAFFGYAAGYNNTTGGSDTFYGTFAGYSNTTACCNVFTGYKSGYGTTTGGFNTFSGWKAGYTNTLGQNNTFEGYQAGYSNTGDSVGGGFDNAFFGYEAGYSNTLGFFNTFSGFHAGYSNTGDDAGDGTYNTFSGGLAGYSNTLGNYNTFVGFQAGYVNTGDPSGNGSVNAFFGAGAGIRNTSGAGNTFLGGFAGQSNTTGSNDVYIADAGPTSGTESNTIRIGGGEAAAYIGGIYGSTASGGIPVYVNSNGQLGTLTSSLRFKEQVRDMGDSTSALMKLRPVTFLYKPEYSNGDRTLQYGLIAEEVAQVYPDLVAYDNDGQPYTVRYQYLAPMLLNELQKEHAVVMTQQDELQIQLQQIKTQRQEIDGLKLQLQQQNASLQLKNASLEDRLSKLESYVATQTRTQTASDVRPVASASPSGNSQ
jgi:hypothetical protein